MRKRRFGRILLIGLLLVVVVLLGLHAYNYVRLDAAQLSASAEPVLERARAIAERARPEYQDLALARLAPNPHNGSYYRLDDNLHDAKVIDEPPPVPTDEEGIILGFEFKDPNNPELVAADGSATPQVEADVLRMPGNGGQDYLTNGDPLVLRRDDVGDILVRARTDKKTWASLAWSSKDESEHVWQNRLDLSLIGDGEFHTYVINGQNALRRGELEDGVIGRLFVRPATTSDTEVEIDFIRFLSKQSRYLRAGNNVTYEMLGGEMRKAIYMLPDQTLEWSLDVPQDSPVLDFGSAVLLGDHPLTFEVSLVGDGGSRVLHSETVGSAPAWHDGQIDLRPWAGQSVRVRLRVTGDAGNVAFWSNPIIRSAPQKRFNVIIVLEDALRADYLSTYGYELETSPHKTALMRERGIQFDWAVSQATKTRPSVPTLMTSLYPSATGVLSFSDMLSDRHLTLAEIMRNQGFTTGAFIQNGNAGPYAGGHQGFSQLFDPTLVEGPPENVLGERLSSWLDQHRDENFFLYLHIGDPHGPYDPPPPYDQWAKEAAGKGEPVEREDYMEPPSVTNPTDQERRARYAGEIRHNDELLATTVKQLDELGLSEDTLLIFLSDHGEFMGEQGNWEHHPPSLLPVIHVQLMMTYPGRFKEPKRITDVVQLADVMPTVLELAEIDATDLLLQGDSLVSLIEGSAPERWRDRLAISEEAMVMKRGDACSCASLFFRDWHVISSTSLWPPDRANPILQDVQTFVKTHVYRYRDDPEEPFPALTFLPDLYVRWLASDTVSSLHELNQTTWRKLTAGENTDLQIDPATLEHLRGLGYIN
jgi:arylsulfatase A-like enzyme